MYVYLLFVHYSVLFIVYYLPAYVDESGVTPAHFAAQRGHIDCLMVNNIIITSCAMYSIIIIMCMYMFILQYMLVLNVLITTNLCVCLCLE